MANKKIHGITIEIGGDTTKLGKALQNVEKTSSHLKTELSDVNRLLKFDPSNVTLLKQKQELLNQSIVSTGNKLKTLKETQEQVQQQFDKGEITEEQYRSFQREIITTENKLKSLNEEAKKFGSVSNQVLSSAASKAKEMGSKIEDVSQKLKTVSVISSAGLIASAKTAIDFETAFTGVEKTVDGTAEQLTKLKQGIRDMAREIPSSTTEISAVAEAAGQLGIKTDDILSFTRVMIDLGNSTNLTADIAASSLAKFSNIMGTTSDNYSRLGSTIVDLGNNFATTEADITNMAMRIAGAGKTIGLSEANVLSLATALSSVGIEAEMGGSAISKTMIKMATAVENGGDSLNKFAKVAGMSTKDFKKCFEEDAATAISKFIVGLGDTENAGKSTLAMLNDLGFDEVRLRDTMLRAANASDVFTNALELGNTAWEENNALTNEANKRYGTTASKMQISLNKIKDIGISLGNKLLPKVEKILTMVDKGVSKFDKLDDKTKNLITTIGLFTAASSPVLKIGGNFLQMGSSLINTLGKLTTPTGLLISSLTMVASGLAYVTANTEKMDEKAIESINSMNELINKQKEVTNTLNEHQKAREDAIKNATVECSTVDILYNKLVDLESVENKTNAQKEIMSDLVARLNELMPNLNLEYDKEKDALNQTTTAIKNQIEAQKELLKAKASQSKLSEIASDIVEQELLIQETIKGNTKAQNDYNEALKKRQEYEKLLKSVPVGENINVNGEEVAFLKVKDEYYNWLETEKKLKTALDESNNSLTNQRERIQKLNEEYANTEKYAENAFNQAEILSNFEKLSKMAEEKGKIVSESLANGIKNGSIAIPKSINEMNKLIDFDNKISELGLQGEKIPLSISQGIINGKLSIEEAVNDLQATINFRNVEDNAQISGVVIPEKLREGLLNGEISIKEASDLVNSWINFEKSYQESIDVGISIPDNIKEGILNGELNITDASNKMNSWIEFNKAVSKATAAGVNVSNELSSNILNGEVNVKNATQSLNEAIEKQLKSTNKIGIDAGGNLTEGLKVGVETGKGSVFSSISNFGKSVLAKLKSALKEHSPSKASEEDAKFLLEGINVGIDKNKGKVFNNISQFGKGTLNKLNQELKKGATFETEFNGTKNIMLNMAAGSSIKNQNLNANPGENNIPIQKVQNNTFNIYNPTSETASESNRKIRKDMQYQHLLYD